MEIPFDWAKDSFYGQGHVDSGHLAVDKKLSSKSIEKLVEKRPLVTGKEMVHGLKIGRKDYFNEEGFKNFLISATRDGPLDIEFRVGKPRYEGGLNQVDRSYFVGEPYNKALYLENVNCYESDSDELKNMARNIKSFAKGLNVELVNEAKATVSKSS